MDMLIRAAVFVVAGIVLLTANFWFVRALHQQFFSREYLIVPFNVIDPAGSAESGRTGEALAQMLAARLSNIQVQLRALQALPQDRSAPEDSVRATALFVSRPVDIPTGLFEPVNIEATVGGVEVGGLFSYFHRQLAQQRAIRFTTYERAERAVVAADLGRFAPGNGQVWFESDRHPDEIAANAAFALLHARLSEAQPGRIRDLDLADFRRLIETVIRVDQLNRRAVRGYVVTDALAVPLAAIEDLLQKVPDWPELLFLAGSTAEGTGNRSKAVLHYSRLQGLPGAGTDPRIRTWAAERLAALGPSAATLRSAAEERFMAAVRDFGRRMALPGPDPEIAFDPALESGIYALWNQPEKRHVVNPVHADTPGLPQYVALMGRFFLLHYERCVAGSTPTVAQATFWNEFRHSVVEYLILSADADADSAFAGFAQNYPLFKALTGIAAEAGTEPAQRLALRMLERYDCDWSPNNIGDRMTRIARSDGLMAPETVLRNLTAAGL